MLQIISNSNETKTGPELVQNGDFSQLGADLVENGLFDELGTDVITNGGFTGETELVINGDFATDLIPWTGVSGRGSYTWDNGKAKITNDGASPYPNLYQAITTEAGKTYKITATVEIGTANNTELRAYSGGVLGSQQLNVDGTMEFTFTAVDASTAIHCYLWETGNTGNYCYFDNVSVKEVGEDWTNGTGWSFGEDKAISTQALGSEEVTNGDFSAAGINLVDNPNFTDTGADVIYNGDFADTSIALGTTGSGWTLSAGLSEYTTFGGDTAVKMTRVTTTNQLRAKTVGGSNVVSANTSYKLTYTVLENNGVTGFRIFASTSTNIPYDVSATPHVVYFTTTDANVLLQFVNDTNNSDITFTDIVVEELGADWTEIGVDPDSASFVANGLKIVQSSDSGLDSRVFQTSVTQDDKSYKVTYTIHSISLTSGNSVKYYNGAAYVVLPEQGVGTHTFYYTRQGTLDNWIFNLATPVTSATDFVTISSISVQELGEDWILQTEEWSIGEDKATYDAAVNAKNIKQLLNFELEKSYKIQFTISTGTAKLKFTNQLGDQLFTNIGIDEYAPNSYTLYGTAIASTELRIYAYNTGGGEAFSITNISVKEIATSYLTQAVSLSAKTWKIIYSVSDYIAGSVSATDYGAVTTANAVGITEYVEIGATSDFRMVNIDGYFEGAVTDISAELVDPNGYWTLGTGWTFGDDKVIYVGSAYDSIFQNIASLSGKSLKVTFEIKDWQSGTIRIPPSNRLDGLDERYSGDGVNVIYFTTTVNYISFQAVLFDGSITNISVEQTDPNNYWTLGTGWSIGTNKAISTVTGSNSDITQSILTAGKTYRTVYEIVDYDAGTAQAVVTGSAGADAVAIETYTEDLTTTGTDFSIRSKLGTFDGAVSSVSAKLLGSYEDQSIYVTAADVQTLPQASVYYLVELTSMASKNSIYFIPSSVVPNNGRYTKLNFTVVSKDALTQPTVGIISFYDSVGGFDTYPMGFYEFKIYEQTSSTNLDPTLATGLLEKGFAFVRDFSGNMQELTDGFKEYNPTLTQYVYSK